MATAYLGNIEVGDGCPVRVMAVLNLSPESFYVDSVARTPAETIEKAVQLAQYADIIDVGAMSTAPYKWAWIPQDEELKRIQAVLPALAKEVNKPISIDSYRPKVVEYALKVGASIVNDVSGLKLYPELGWIAADYGVSMVIMARERTPRPGIDPVARVIGALGDSIKYAVECGVDPRKIVVDPGIGFPTLPSKDEPYVIEGEYRHGDINWPWWRWDLHIIENLPKLKVLGRPVLVGVSRKSFLRRITGAGTPDVVLPASLAAEALAVYLGADVVRTHNPAETCQAVMVAHQLRLMANALQTR